MRLNESRTSLERLIKQRRGVPSPATTAERIEAARLAKTIRPFFLVTALDSEDATLSSREIVSVPVDPPGFPLIVQSFMTDQQQADVLFNFQRPYERNRPMFTSALRASFFAGDFGGQTNRVAPQDPFYLPEPFEIDEDERYTIQLRGRDDKTDQVLTNTYFVMQGLFVHKDTSDEAQLTKRELDDIKAQIANTPQRTAIARCPIDYTTADTSTAIEFEKIDEYAMLLGIATTAKWSLVKVIDPTNHFWTNNIDGIPSGALASHATYQDGTSYEIFRMFSHPYLISPRRPLKLTCAKRPTTGGFTNAIVEDDVVEFTLLYRTV